MSVSIKTEIDTTKLLILNARARDKAISEIGSMAVAEMASRAQVVTGALRDSIQVLDTEKYGVRAGSNLVYAEANEYVYEGNAFARPSLPEIKRKAEAIINTNYRRSLEGV